MERLPEDVPRLKADWLNTGDTAAFKTGLQAFAPRAWTVSIEKFKPVALQPLWCEVAGPRCSRPPSNARLRTG